MNIDPHLLRGLSYFRREAQPATYTSVVPSGYTPASGAVQTTDVDYPVTALLQRHDKMVIGEVISADDMFCIIYGKITFTPKDDDKITISGTTYRLKKVYRNISRQVILANVH